MVVILVNPKPHCINLKTEAAPRVSNNHAVPVIDGVSNMWLDSQF